MFPDHLGDSTAGLPVGDWISVIMALFTAWLANGWPLAVSACLRGLEFLLWAAAPFSDDCRLHALVLPFGCYLPSSTLVPAVASKAAHGGLLLTAGLAPPVLPGPQKSGSVPVCVPV